MVDRIQCPIVSYLPFHTNDTDNLLTLSVNCCYLSNILLIIHRVSIWKPKYRSFIKKSEKKITQIS